MLTPMTLLCALQTFTSAARADDLAVVLQQTGNPNVALTYHAVQPGILPGILLQGGKMRVEIEVTPVPIPVGCTDCVPQVRLDTRIYETRRHREKLVASPSITAMVGQEATVTQVMPTINYAVDGTVSYTFDGLSVELLYTAP
jgi:hypothetical protein